MTGHDKRYVIIGNGIAGTTAAETLRKQDATCSIHLLTNEPYPLYNRVSLPRFLQGVLMEQKVMIRDFPWHEQRGIGFITETMVTSINTDERVVVTERGQHLPYDALLIATGGWANPCGCQEQKGPNISTTLSPWMIPEPSSPVCLSPARRSPMAAASSSADLS